MEYKCPNCSNSYAPGTKFCRSCGTSLEPETTASPTCPVCNTTYPPYTKFCPADGTPLSAVNDQPARPQAAQYVVDYSLNKPAQRYPKANLGNRFIAMILDGLISFGLCLPAIIAFVAAINDSRGEYFGETISLFFLAFAFVLIPIIYQFIKDGLGQGQSWGKKAVGIMVINLDNDMPCDIGKSFLRQLISSLVGLIPFVGWLIEPVLALAAEDGRKLGDKAASTQVIDVENFKYARS